MKVKQNVILTLFTAIVLTSCGSTPAEKNQTGNNSAPVIETVRIAEEPEQEIIIEETEDEKFIKSLANVKIAFSSSPTKPANLNRAFNASYVITAKDNSGSPLADYALTILYPSAKNETVISYSTADVLTDENGSYTFTPETPAFAADTVVTAYPTPVSDSEEVKNAVMNVKATAEWKVKSDIISKGAVLFIWDFNEKDRPVNNSYDVLSEFRTRGMTMVGNAPINETSYIGKSLNTLYKENYEIIEDSYGYLIVGTIKFTKPVEPVDDQYLCSLTADIQAVNMKNGTKVFGSTFTNEATGKNWNACVSTCKEQLAKKVVDALVYGL